MTHWKLYSQNDLCPVKSCDYHVILSTSGIMYDLCSVKSCDYHVILSTSVIMYDLCSVKSCDYHVILSTSVIMLDEAHERTLYTDIAVGLLKKVLKK